MMYTTNDYYWPTSEAKKNLDEFEKRLRLFEHALTQEAFANEMERLTFKCQDRELMIRRLEYVFERMGINPRETPHWIEPID